eukprot:tig00000852_g5020.t2
MSPSDPRPPPPVEGQEGQEPSDVVPAASGQPDDDAVKEREAVAEELIEHGDRPLDQGSESGESEVETLRVPSPPPVRTSRRSRKPPAPASDFVYELPPSLKGDKPGDSDDGGDAGSDDNARLNHQRRAAQRRTPTQDDFEYDFLSTAREQLLDAPVPIIDSEPVVAMARVTGRRDSTTDDSGSGGRNQENGSSHASKGPASKGVGSKAPGKSTAAKKVPKKEPAGEKDGDREEKRSSASKGPASKGPASKAPAKGPASKGPASKGPASKGPASKGPASKGPAAKKPKRDQEDEEYVEEMPVVRDHDEEYHDQEQYEVVGMHDLPPEEWMEQHGYEIEPVEGYEHGDYEPLDAEEMATAEMAEAAAAAAAAAGLHYEEGAEDDDGGYYEPPPAKRSRGRGSSSADREYSPSGSSAPRSSKKGKGGGSRGGGGSSSSRKSEGAGSEVCSGPSPALRTQVLKILERAGRAMTAPEIYAKIPANLKQHFGNRPANVFQAYKLREMERDGDIIIAGRVGRNHAFLYTLPGDPAATAAAAAAAGANQPVPGGAGSSSSGGGGGGSSRSRSTSDKHPPAQRSSGSSSSSRPPQQAPPPPRTRPKRHRQSSATADEYVYDSP